MASGTVCVVCNQVNPPGAIECLKCTAPLRVSNTVLLSDQLKQEIVRESRAYQGELEAGTMTFHFVGRRQPLLVQVKDEVVLGRYTGEDTLNVADLTEFRAGLLGVSRRHAAIQPTEDGYAIVDLNSTNGTWVNGNPLSPGIEYTLESGDNLQLGELTMYVYFRPTE